MNWLLYEDFIEDLHQHDDNDSYQQKIDSPHKGKRRCLLTILEKVCYYRCSFFFKQKVIYIILNVLIQVFFLKKKVAHESEKDVHKIQNFKITVQFTNRRGLTK